MVDSSINCYIFGVVPCNKFTRIVFLKYINSVLKRLNVPILKKVFQSPNLLRDNLTLRENAFEPKLFFRDSTRRIFFFLSVLSLVSLFCYILLRCCSKVSCCLSYPPFLPGLLKKICFSVFVLFTNSADYTAQAKSQGLMYQRKKKKQNNKGIDLINLLSSKFVF